MVKLCWLSSVVLDVLFTVQSCICSNGALGGYQLKGRGRYSQGLVGAAAEVLGAETGQRVGGDGRQEGAESLAKPQADEGLALIDFRGEHLQPDVVDGLQDQGGGGIAGVEGLDTGREHEGYVPL